MQPAPTGAENHAAKWIDLVAAQAAHAGTRALVGHDVASESDGGAVSGPAVNGYSDVIAQLLRTLRSPSNVLKALTVFCEPSLPCLKKQSSLALLAPLSPSARTDT